MDRRMMAPGPQLTRPNSYIPTSSANSSSSTNQGRTGNNGKLDAVQIQQLALQSQLQAQHQNHTQVTNPIGSNMLSYQQYNNVFSSVPPTLPSNQPVSTQHHQFSHATLPKHTMMSETLSNDNHAPPPLKTRTLQRKPFPSQYVMSYNPAQQRSNPDPLYGNLGIHGHVSNQPPHPPPAPPQHTSYQQEPPGRVQRQPQQFSPPTTSQPNQIQPVINQIQQQHHSAKILQQFPAVTNESDGLPPSLVESMRTLFDILDDSKQGRVRLSDIESRWENGEGSSSGGSGKGNTGAEPLIKMGVMGYLRKVTPPDGMLTFDRFCSGLRLALVTNHKSSGTFDQGHSIDIPQSSTHLHVKPVSHNFYSNNNRSVMSNCQIASTNSSAKLRPTSLPTTAINHNVTQMSTVHRGMSRIPGFSTTQSKVPMSSGSPPKNKFSVFQNQNGNSSGMGTARRVVLNPSQPSAEQGTTVVMVHQPPLVGGVVPPFTQRPHDLQIGTVKLTKPSLVTPPNGGFTKYKSISQNGSLDNLKTDEEKKDGKTVEKLRPPSAPLLDTTDDDDGGTEYYINRNAATRRERARSGDRGLDEAKQRGKLQNGEDNFGKRVVSFVTPRQRTLSMPQLQLNKLNAKIVPLDDDSSPSLSSSSHSPLSSGETKRGGLKSSLKSPSSIPTKMTKQKSEPVTMTRTRSEPPSLLSFKANSTDDSNNDPLAPPKPPRNNNSLTIPDNNGSTTPDQLLSESSTSTINHPSKPEIRQYLQSWKQGVAEKRPQNESDSSIPPPLPNQPPPNTKIDSIQPHETENITNGTVKLRSDKKLNLRRRETARRHTVQAGIDFATLKRLKQLEQERDVLHQGLGVIETSREWYRKQMEGIEDKISTMTKGALIPDQWSDSLEERLNLLSCRILEINSLLAVLMDETTTRIPSHMNLQIPSHLSVRTITQLKEQNKQLTQEVSDCSHRVTQLETEKAMLLRQLFHQKSSHLTEETVYM